MDCRRSQLDERRRRVLMEEVAGEGSEEETTSPPAEHTSTRAPTRAYSELVLTERQPRVSDLIPRRPMALVVLVLALLTAVAAIETLYIHWETSPRPSLPAGAQARLPAEAIDLAARGNLATWFSTLLLASGAALSVAIYLIRCHREDDYRGRYRVWLSAVAALLWASLDAATGIHATIGGILALGANRPELAGLAWLGLYLTVFGAMGIRLAIETWHSVGSFATLSLAALLYLAAGMMAVGWLPLPGLMLATVIGTTLTMLAHVALISGLAIYARHVHLDAQGKLPLRLQAQSSRPKKKSRPKPLVAAADRYAKPEAASPAAAAKPTDAIGADASLRAASVGASAARPGPLASRVAAAGNVDDEDEGDEDADVPQHLSKAERRRLKRLMRQQRRAA
jgi:hypothetical protein